MAFPVLQTGSGMDLPRGLDEVKQIQEFLNRQGYTDLNGNPLEVDGKFGPLTESAVVAFQEANNLSADGIIGPKTFGQIKFVSADQDRKIDSVLAGFGDEGRTREEVLAAIRDRIGVDDAEGLLTDRGIDVNDYARNDDKFYRDPDISVDAPLPDVINDVDPIIKPMPLPDPREGGATTLPGELPWEPLTADDDTPLAPDMEADSMDDFFGALEEIGISGRDAQELWTLLEQNFLDDPNYSLADNWMDIYETNAFMNRFPGLWQMVQDRKNSDDPTSFDIPSIPEYLALEDSVINNMALLNQEIPNMTDLMTTLVTQGVDANELQDRFDLAERVIGASVPEEVASVYDRWFGGDGQNNLIMTILDPEDETGASLSWTEIEENVGVAEVGGWAEFVGGISLARDTAERINSLNQTQASLWDGFTNIKNMEDLFIERIGEEDFTAKDEGVEATFFGDDSVMRRRDERIADFTGGGGAMLTQQGTGLGSA